MSDETTSTAPVAEDEASVAVETTDAAPEAAAGDPTTTTAAPAAPEQTDDSPADDEDDGDTAGDLAAWRGKAEKRLKELKTVRAQRDALRAEQAALTTKVSELSTQVESGRNAATRLAEIEPRLRTLSLTNEVMRLAPAKRIADPELAVKALDAAAIEFGPDGRPSNLDTVLDTVLDRHPALRGAGPVGALGNQAHQRREPQTTVGDLASKTQAEIAAFYRDRLANRR